MERVRDRKQRRGAERGEEDSGFKVEDRRHWARRERGEPDDDGDGAPASTRPTVIDEYRQRAEAAERKLHEYIDAHKQFRDEQERFRERLQRDVGRRAEERFGNLVSELLDTVDHLELALGHVEGVAGAEPLAEGVALARDRFLTALERNGVERLDPQGREFDPNESEAMQLEPVSDPEQDGKVVRTLRPGYRLGDRVIRAARVAVGKLSG